MTVLTLTMPRLGETMQEGQIVGWMVAPGEAFRRGQPILELETDKTVVEFPALGDGVIDEVIAGPGDRVGVGQPIARARVVAVGDWAGNGEAAVEEIETAVPQPVAVVAAGAEGGALRATPLARRIARTNGVALDGITGSGRRGRIERADVERAIGAPAAGDPNWLDLPGGRLAYAVAGGSGRVHLLIHGLTGDRNAWAHLTAALTRAGHTAVVPDLPGHGATTLEAADLEPLVEAVTRLAGTVSGPVTLVGHSLGAAVAVAAAGRLGPGVGRVVLLAPAGCGPGINAGFLRGMVAAQTPGEVAHLLRRLGPKGGALSEPALAQLAAEMARGRLVDLARTLASADGRQRIDILRPLALLAAQTPVMALFGTEDQVVPASDALNLPPQVAAHFLPAGHMPQWDVPREVVDLILKGGADG
ncbi:MAG: acetoin dehydrogenase dihydrolipoyllysine-residue acetyltransferase subunit [Alphaproteobacteria bacterium HGW-Alphaproteobacteria-6]|nr:MAG: acetoin dehydrogenase dihydrolipoyllysine-residue acetyltransferase subunit [Alphaproteobacteria bacterium HGW-Alphaproteobacteria-6]